MRAPEGSIYFMSSTPALGRATPSGMTGLCGTSASLALTNRRRSRFNRIKAKDGKLKAVNLTPTVKGTHLGVLGRPAADFPRSELTPMNRFWDKRGKRYTVSGPFMISDRGEVGGQ
jgi:hypothetical protein